MSPCPSRERMENLLRHDNDLNEVGEQSLQKHIENCDRCREIAEEILRDPEIEKWRKLFVPAPSLETRTDSLEGSPFDPEAIPEPLGVPLPPSSMAGYIGQVDHFHIVRKLGGGAMGVVLLARDERLGTLVAIKFLKPELAALERYRTGFEREGRNAAAVKHEYVVSIHQARIAPESGLPYLVMEYIEGESLDVYLREQKVPPPREAVKIARQAAAGLAAAHNQGQVHRDIKPSNIMLEKHSGRARITDFGLARAIDGSDAITHSEGVVGKAFYMSPEQIESPKRVDERSDIFSLGIVLYEMLTGERPFRGTTNPMIMQQIVYEEPISPRKLNDAVSRDLETTTLKCLSKEPARRYQTAAELGDDLQRWLNGEPIRARPVGAAARLWRWCRRKPGLAAASALAAAALVAVAVVSAAFALHAKAALHDSQKRLAIAALDRGIDLCEKGEVGPGMHWGVRSLQLAPPGDHDLHRAIRLNLAGWRSRLSPVRAILLEQADMTRVSFSRDGTMMATGSADGTVRLWDGATGSPRTGPLHRHRGAVTAMAFSPDGGTLATGADDNTAWLWDVVTGRARFEPPLRHVDRLSSVTFSPNGQMLVTGCDDKTARLWEVTTGSERPGSPLRHESKFSDARVTSVALSPDGTKVLTGCTDRFARLWMAETGRPILRLEHSREVTAVAFNPTGEIIATASADWTVQLWETGSGKPLGLVLPHPGEVTVIAFNPDGSLLVTGCTDNNARVWNVAREKTWSVMAIHQPVLLLRHQGAVNGLGFSSEGRSILTASMDGFIRSWESPAARPADRVLTNNFPAWAVAFSPDGLNAVIASEGYPEFWELATGQRVDLKGRPIRDSNSLVGDRLHQLSSYWKLPDSAAHAGGIRAVVFSPDGRSLVTGGSDGTARFWNRMTDRRLRLSPPHQGPVEAITFDGRTIVTGSYDHTGQVWGASTAKVRGSLPHEGPVVSVALSRDGKMIVTGSHDRTARFWDAVTCQERQSSPLPHESKVFAVALSPDGTRVATGTEDGSVHLWSVASGKRLLEQPLRHAGPVMVVAFSPDGRLVLTASKDNTARLWDAATGNPHGPPLEHQHWVRRATFSPDGSFILTGSDDRTARLWDTATSKPCGPPIEHQHEVLSIAFSPNGRLVLTGSRDRRRTVRLTEVPTAVEGDNEQLRLWVQVLTGIELDDNDVFRALSVEEWQVRKRRLAELRGSMLP